MAVAPECPYSLASAGEAWWAWAWATAQAEQWTSTAALYAAARRARLEDELAALTFGEDEVELADLLAGADREAVRRVEFALSTLKRAATGSVSLSKEMRELETQLGLGPKAMAGLGLQPSSDKKGDTVDDLARKRSERRAGSAAP